jgi:hypothetical protein
VVVDFTAAQEKVTGLTWDVSLSGMFVRTTRMPEEGQRLFVTLRFADGRQLLLQGEVVRTFHAPALIRHLFPTGFGMAIKNSESYRRFVSSLAGEEPEASTAN